MVLDHLVVLDHFLWEIVLCRCSALQVAGSSLTDFIAEILRT